VPASSSMNMKHLVKNSLLSDCLARCEMASNPVFPFRTRFEMEVLFYPFAKLSPPLPFPISTVSTSATIFFVLVQTATPFQHKSKIEYLCA
jgi:hypothetical protein